MNISPNVQMIVQKKKKLNVAGLHSFALYMNFSSRG